MKLPKNINNCTTKYQSLNLELQTLSKNLTKTQQIFEKTDRSSTNKTFPKALKKFSTMANKAPN